MAKKTFTSVDEFMLKAWGKTPPDNPPGNEAVTLYREVHARLTRLQQRALVAFGQPVVVINRRAETTGCSMGMPVRLRWPRIEESLNVGILQSPGLTMSVDREGLVTDTLTCALATDGHVRAWGALGRWHTRKDDGPITDDVLHPWWYRLEVPMEDSERSLRGPLAHVEIVVGADDVYAWAAREGTEYLLRDALRLLDREVTFGALTKRMDRDRAANAAALERLWTECQTVAARVRSVQTAGREGAGVISTDGFSLTLCENEDDAFWITLGDRDRLKSLVAELRRRLATLRDLGVNDATPNIHLIRHISQKLNEPMP